MQHINKINQKGLDLIKYHEGCSLQCYTCPAGYLTIGYGHLCCDGDWYLKSESISNARMHKEDIMISKKEAEELLKCDILISEKSVLKLINVPLNINQFSALVSFTFNVGNAALQRSTLRAKINRKEYDSAVVEFSRWVYSNGYKLKCLVNRRIDEAILFSK